MTRIALLFVLFCAFTTSCTKPKTVKVPVSYKIETEYSPTGTVDDVFIPQSGVYHLRLTVKFITGATNDQVTVRLAGLPGTIKVAVDSAKGVPTYVADFTLTVNAPLAEYPVTVTTSAPGTETKTYNFKIHTVTNDCRSFVAGTYAGTNACTARSYNYSMTVTGTGTANQVAITNFGGYGTSTTTYATLNCNRDSMFITNQNIGNGTILQGVGTFTGSQIKIWYTASSTPTGSGETCSATLNKL